jgi:hypothetical protein
VEVHAVDGCPLVGRNVRHFDRSEVVDPGLAVAMCEWLKSETGLRGIPLVKLSPWRHSKFRRASGSSLAGQCLGGSLLIVKQLAFCLEFHHRNKRIGICFG